MLRGHPDAVEEVIHDLLYTFYMREQPRPSRLFSIMMRSNLLWHMALRAEADPDILGQEGSAEVSDPALIRAASSYVMNPPLKVEANKTYLVPQDFRAIAVNDFLSETGRLDMIASVLSRHTYYHPIMKCSCNRPYSDRESWAHHVSIRIVRALKNEFPPIGEATDQAISSPQPA